LEIIRRLWSGGYHSYQGKHLRLEDARVFDLPDPLPVIAVAASGPASALIAAQLGSGLFATEAKPEIVEAYRGAGGDGPRYGEVSLAFASDEDRAIQAVLQRSRWPLSGWKVMSELPNPVNFDAASRWYDADDVRQMFSVGPTADTHVAAVRRYLDAGFDHIVLLNAGPDPDAFIDFFASGLHDKLRALTPVAAR
jgi:G6PDH family F420-dependent oxidoreductase